MQAIAALCHGHGVLGSASFSADVWLFATSYVVLSSPPAGQPPDRRMSVRRPLYRHFHFMESSGGGNHDGPIPNTTSADYLCFVETQF
jgi:hypothetical protein